MLQNDIGTTDAHVLGGARRGAAHDAHLHRRAPAAPHLLPRLFDALRRRAGRMPARATTQPARTAIYHLCVGQFEAATTAKRSTSTSTSSARAWCSSSTGTGRANACGCLLPARPRRATAANGRRTTTSATWRSCAPAASDGLRVPGDLVARSDRLRRTARRRARAGRRRGALHARRYVRICAAGPRCAASPKRLVSDEVRAELIGLFRSGQERRSTSRRSTPASSWRSRAACATPAAGAAARSRRGRSSRRRAARKPGSAPPTTWSTAPGPPCAATRRRAFFRSLIENADDVADELEDAAYHLTLLPRGAPPPEVYGALRRARDLLVQGVQEYVKALATVRTSAPADRARTSAISSRRFTASCWSSTARTRCSALRRPRW